MLDLTHVAEALRLAAMGYRRISNAYRTVARVDRADWREHMAKTFAPWDVRRGTTEGTDWVRCLGDSAADHYRRCYSLDYLKGLHPDVFHFIPSSGGDPTGHVHVPDSQRRRRA